MIEQMKTLSESIEARVSKLLLSLVKMEKEKNSKLQAAAGKNSTLKSDKFKNMYREVLCYKMMTSGKRIQTNEQEEGEDSSPTFSIFDLLESLSEGIL